MNRPARSHILPSMLLLLLGTLLGLGLSSFLPADDPRTQLRKLEDAFLYIQKQYVEEVDPEREVESAIEGMLGALDPHSSYIPAEELEAIQDTYEGHFGGVGIWFVSQEDTAQVVQVVADGPSDRAGLRPGDRIVAVDGEPVTAVDDDAIVRMLKGPIGTEVAVTVRRLGRQQPLTFTVERGRIEVETVEAAYMLDEQTGYLKVGQFAVTTYSEFLEQVKTLREEGMQRLVLDLRDNPGGVMSSAALMVDEMLGGSLPIVETRGRAPGTTEQHRSSQHGVLKDEPIIVLVNTFSASASEIIAGALQDHDRALIVGQRTFGKALVQQQFPLRDGSVLQMTVSRYYTPAGRLIQTPYENGALDDYYADKFAGLEESLFSVRDYVDRVPDSLRFETTHGRTVYGGGGILPDFLVPPDTTSDLRTYVASTEPLDFVRSYFSANEQALRAAWGEQPDRFIETYGVDEAFWRAFTAEMAETMRDDAPLAQAAPAFAPDQLAANRADLEQLLKAYLGRQLYSSRAWHRLYNRLDPTLAQIPELWEQAEELAAYHR